MLKNQFPRVYNEIESKWGSRAGRDYLMSLIMDSRDGDRKGFPAEVAEEIIMILKQHDKEFPNLDATHDIAPSYSFTPPKTRARPESTGINLFAVMRYVVIAVLLIGAVFKLKKMFL
jgi:hypothetical protein